MTEIATLGLRVDGTANIDSATQSLGRFSRSGQNAEKAAGGLSNQSQKSSKSLADVSRESDRASGSINRLASAARSVVGILGAAFGVREILNYADAWQNAENQLRIVTRTTEELAIAQQRVADIAVDTRGNFSATARLYSRLARSTEALGLSQSELVDLTTTINQSFAVSGATAEEASNAITQLSQGLSAGALRGDEFNSVAEQAPGILRAVAQSLNMGIGELRDFAATGGITAETVVTALQQASDEIAGDFAGSVATFGQQMEVARTQLTQWVGENNNIRSAVNGVGDAIVSLTGGLQNHSDAVNAVTGALLGATTAYYGYSVAAGVASKATAAFMRLLRVNPLVAAATAIVSIGSAMYAARDATITFGDTQGTLSQWMQGTWTTLSNLFESEFAGAVNAATEAFEPFGETVGNVASYVWNTFDALLGNIVDAASLTANGIIAYFLTVRDTMGIVARAIYSQFTNAFDNVLNVASEFWSGVQSIFRGEIDFSGFQNAVAQGIINPLADAGGEIAQAFADNFSADYLGDTIQFFSEDIEAFGDSVASNVRAANMEFRTLEDWLLRAPDSISPVSSGIEKLSDAAKEAKKEAEQFASSLDTLIDTLFPVEAAQRTYREEQEVLTRAWNEGTITAERYTEAMRRLERAQLSAQTASGAYGGGGGFGSEIGSRGEAGSPTDPLARNEDEDYWTKWLESAETALTDFDSLAANSAENFQRSFGNAFESMVFDSQNFGDAMYNLFDGIARSLVSALGEMAAQWLAYQAVQLIVGKTTQATAASGMVANALAQQQMAGLNAFASTAAIPIVGPVVAPAAMAAAIAATAPSVAAITSLSAAGMAHDGIDRIPREGTWLLDQGERVVSRPQADRLDAYLSRQEQPRRSQAVAPVVNVIENPNRAGASEQRQDQDGKWVIDIFVANIQQGGKADKAIRSNYGLRRQGV